MLEAARRYADKPNPARVVPWQPPRKRSGSAGGRLLALSDSDRQWRSSSTWRRDGSSARREEGTWFVPNWRRPISRSGWSTFAVGFSLLTSTAQAKTIRFRVQANGGPTGTDADAVARASTGGPVGLVSIPSRYMHSANAFVSLDDMDSTITLIARPCGVSREPPILLGLSIERRAIGASHSARVMCSSRCEYCHDG